MKKVINTLFIGFLYFIPLQAQGDKEIVRKEIIAVVDNFFAAMHNGDTMAMKLLMSNTAMLKTVDKGRTVSTPYNTFLMSIAMKRPNVWLEKLYNYEIKIDGDMATAWTEYSFFLDGKLSHCGVNHFVITKEKDLGLRILMIIDTRRNTGCLTEESRQSIEKTAIDSMLNKWHRAAATADEAVFFDSSMTKDGIYLGTDITERWYRDELKSWAKSAFDKEVAWAFSPSQRQIYFNENDTKIAWFEETLDTWMGPCRGSGVLMKVNGSWKIKHYNLAVAVANNVIEKYLKFIGKKKKKK
jgi:hypothetical protein